MAKGAKQPKIKIAQPIALEPRLRDILERHGVRKGPTVDKVEALQKAATAKKWLFTIKEDRKDGLAHASLEVPGPDGLLYFEAEAMTIPLAMTHALCDALENGPQQSNFLDDDRTPTAPPDPSGADLPMFRGNGGVAGPIGVSIDQQQIADELAKDIEAGIQNGTINGVTILADGTVGDSLANPWTFLFVVNPADVKTWKTTAPVDEYGSPIVDFEEGDELNDRGWYLDPDYTYDHNTGEIRVATSIASDGELVWSREAATKAEAKAKRKGATPKASNTTAAQAEALHLAGAQALPVS